MHPSDKTGRLALRWMQLFLLTLRSTMHHLLSVLHGRRSEVTPRVLRKRQETVLVMRKSEKALKTATYALRDHHHTASWWLILQPWMPNFYHYLKMTKERKQKIRGSTSVSLHTLSVHRTMHPQDNVDNWGLRNEIVNQEVGRVAQSVVNCHWRFEWFDFKSLCLN